ncbi:MAG TPA: hypothetical protein VKB80_28540 [Kofleriaceae bacterium]|nr:hypothetical protein [Kofleriaceae bacterium]
MLAADGAWVTACVGAAVAAALRERVFTDPFATAGLAASGAAARLLRSTFSTFATFCTFSNLSNLFSTLTFAPGFALALLSLTARAGDLAAGLLVPGRARVRALGGGVVAALEREVLLAPADDFAADAVDFTFDCWVDCWPCALLRRARALLDFDSPSASVEPDAGPLPGGLLVTSAVGRS